MNAASTPESNPIRVTFICSGNICRSPYAEAALRHRLKDESWGARIVVVSAGTLGIFGEPAHRTTCEVAAESEIDVTAHRSQGWKESELRRSDLVLCMEKEHAVLGRRLFPELSERFYLLTTFPEASLDGEAIPDPIGRPREAFEDAHARIDAALETVVRELRRISSPGRS